jgi:tetratricopeptide (TPR) repeat protein
VSLTVKIFFVAFIVLLIAASTSQETLLWGASSWRVVSLTTATIFAAALLLLLTGRIRNGFARVLDIPDRISRKASIAMTASAIVLLWLMRSGHFLWGDGYSTGLAVERGVTMIPSAPLAAALSRGFFELLNRLLFWNSFETSALLSVIAGIFFAASVRASLGAASSKGTFPAAAFTLTCGYFAVFFGFGGSAPLATAGMGLFIWLSIVHLRGGAIPLVVPALAATAAILLHVSNIFLIAPLLYLLLSAARNRESRLESAAAAGTIAACWIAVDLAASRFAGLPGISSHLADTATRTFSSLAGTGAAGTLSLAFNSLVLAGPAALLAVVLAVTRSRSHEDTAGHRSSSGPHGPGTMGFLLVTAASATVFIFLAAPRIRGGLRWELVVPASAAMAVYAAAALRSRAASLREFKATAAVLAALGLFHLIPVVVTNFSLEAGEKRLLDLPLPPGKAETLIGAQAWYERDYGKAAEWWSSAAEKDQENAGIWHRLGLAEMKLENSLDAITWFHRASGIDPENHVYRTDLAEAFIEQRWFREASQELEVLVSEFPDSARLWTRFGYVWNHSHKYQEAIEAYSRALELDPENKEYIRNLTSAVLNRGAEFQKNDDYDSARKMYRYARRLYPTDWVSLNNLATLEMELSDWEGARKILAMALQEHSEASQLHFNMSVVLENLGEYEEALEHLRKTARLDILNPPTREHFERLLRKAGQPIPRQSSPDDP